MKKISINDEKDKSAAIHDVNILDLESEE